MSRDIQIFKRFVFAADDLPEKWAHFAEKNSAHFGR